MTQNLDCIIACIHPQTTNRNYVNYGLLRLCLRKFLDALNFKRIVVPGSIIAKLWTGTARTM